ncbi:uncharacterized protein MYCFIDRAFT_135631 [Pseudocercospora fijiensis CIRAD86]|uniref:Nucleoside phosphorylase domain-containing protein n=1 Tax=Pseudocercospora fijiensis (strain CIRAD86) TaxID=383855 RepID=M2Z4B8_PSEFD|nr:uncharacterized protein MYCFIDRAFT_135631 [Pseudocercospora fijiensis CIRAD86]EME84660.1 hypothetical protein MYCFIDRAFT_135631 [Pseudocercospora fijiensis CIRAD86]
MGDRITHITGNNASGNSRQHNGNVFSGNTFNYGASPTPSEPQARLADDGPKSRPPDLAAGARPRTLDDFRIAIICALQIEFDAVDILLEEVYEGEDAFRPRHPDTNTYTFGRLGGKPVVLVNLPSMGKVSAATVATNLGITFKYIEIAFLTGICGGAPHDDRGNKIQYGDVIIGKQVIQEDFGRLMDDGMHRKTEVEDVLGRLPPRIRQWIGALSGWRNLKGLKSDVTVILEKTFQDAEFVKMFAFPERREGEVGRSELQIFLGRVATSDAVLKSAERRDRMIEQDKVIGFEMESAGMWDQLPTVLVKSVCDFANVQKSKEWQPFAALTAAATTQAMVRKWTFQVYS